MGLAVVLLQLGHQHRLMQTPEGQFTLTVAGFWMQQLHQAGNVHPLRYTVTRDSSLLQCFLFEFFPHDTRPLS